MADFARFIRAYDYVIGAWLIALPWLFRFSHVTSATLVSVVLGFSVIVNSLFTNYQYGWVRFIPKPIHRLADLTAALFLTTAPWLFAYHEETVWPHLLTGLFYLIFATVRWNRITLLINTNKH